MTLMPRFGLALLLVAVVAAATLETPPTAWAQSPSGSQQLPVDVPELVQAVVPSSDGFDAVVQLDGSDSGDSLLDVGEGQLPPDAVDEVVLPFEVQEGFDVTEGLAPDLLPEEIEGHELGSEPLDLSIAGLLDDDGIFEWRDGQDVMSLRRLPVGEAAAVAFSGSDAVAATTALQDLAASAAVSYVPVHDGLSNETSAVVQKQADNWFVSDTGQLFLPVGGVLILFDSGINAAAVDAIWSQFEIAPGRVSAVEGLPNAFKIDTSSDVESLQLVRLLSQAPGVESVTPNMFTPDSTGSTGDLISSVPVSRYPTHNANATKLCSSDEPPLSDALSKCLWHLKPTKKGPVIIGNVPANINIGNVWDTTMGAGVTVSVVDKTWEADHEDLIGNANRSASTYWGGHKGENGTSAYHATATAGIIAARDNVLGGRGVAPRAKLLNVNYIDWQATHSSVQAYLHRMNTVAIASHHYQAVGARDLHRFARISADALEESLKSGFGGKGIVHVKGVGNYKIFGDEATLEERNNHYGLIVACAVNSDGDVALYSEEGSMLWVCGPSGDFYNPGMLAPIGKNEYHAGLLGTSYSAPVVSGVAALVRSANTNLTWRDVKLILAGTAQKNKSTDSSWQAGARKYRSTTDSYSYSRKFGFGLVDASAAVAAAKTWKTLPPLFANWAESSESGTITKSGGNKTFTIDLTSDISFIEHVDVNINMSTTNFNRLKMTLVSPTGRESLLVTGSSRSTPCACSLNGDFKLASARHLGESASGTWKLKISNSGDAHPAELRSWRITVHGHNPARTEAITLSTSANVTEGDTFDVTVARKGTPLTTDLVVPIVLSPVGANPPSHAEADYEALTSITIPAGALTATATVPTNEDNVHEPTERVIVSIGRLPTPYYAEGWEESIRRLISIIDDDHIEVSIKAVKSSILEGEEAVFELTTNIDSAQPIRVPFRVFERPIAQPASYLKSNSLLIYTIAFTSADTKTIRVATVEDQFDDPSRDIWAQLVTQGAPFRVKGHDHARVQVSDDLPRVSVVAKGDIVEAENAVFDFSVFPVPSSPLTLPVEVTASGFFGIESATRTITFNSSGKAQLFLGTKYHTFGQPSGAVAVTIAPPDSTEWYLSPTRNSATVAITDINGDGSPHVVAASLIAKVRTHAANELAQGRQTRANLYKRALLAFGETPSGVTGSRMTAAEARTYTGAGLPDWAKIIAELALIQASRPETPVVAAVAGNDIVEGDDATFTLRSLPVWHDDIDVTVMIIPTGSFNVALSLRTLTIPAGNSATLTLPTKDDDVGELDGSITVSVLNGTGYNRYMFGTASLAVADNDGSSLPKVSVSAGSAVTEGAAASFTLTASPAPASALDVSVNVTASGSYGITTGAQTVTIPTSGTATLTLSTSSDNLPEPDGSVSVALVDGAAYNLNSSASKATVAISDNDTPTVSITAGSAVTEGSSALFTLTASPAPAANLDVTVNVTASGDYGVTTGSQTVTIPASGTATLNIATSGDSTDEVDGSVTVTVNTGNGYDVDSSASSATVAISDDDASVSGVPAKLIADVRGYAAETDNGVAHVNRWKRVLLAFGESVPGFTGTPMTVTEAQGFASQFWSVRWDPVVTALQALAANTHIPTTPEVSITAGSAVTEGTAASFTLTANPAPSANLDVSVTVSASGSYGVTTGNQTVTIGTSGTTTLTINTTDDTVDEVNGSVTATLVDGAAYDLDSTASAATVNIADDDIPEVSITAGSNVTEGTAASFTLTADPVPHISITVNVAVTANGNYGVTTGNQTVTIPTSGTAILTVATSGDTVDEVNGSATVTLNIGNNYSIDSSASAATVNIADDDDSSVYVVPAKLIADVRGYAAETINGVAHVTRWKRVLVAFGESVPGFSGTPMTVVEAQENAIQFWNIRWDPVVTALQALAANSQTPATPTVSITAGSAITEGSNATFTLTANPPPSTNLDVSVNVTASGAYGVTTGSQTVTIPASGTATLTVATTGDSTDEADGSVTATLVDGAAYDLDSSASAATVNIADDDIPEVSIAAGSAVTEGTSASFALIADPAPHSSITANITVTASGNYGVTAGSRTVTIGTSGTATLTVATTGDSTDEADGSVTVTINTGSNYSIDSSASAATVNISDDDDPLVLPPPLAVPVVGITAGSDITEGGTALFTFTANPAPASSFGVTVRVTASGSYGITTGTRTVTIPTTGTATLNISTTGDTVDEANGSVTVTLVDGAAYDLDSSASTAAVNIADDDVPEVSIAAGSDVTEGSAASFTLTADPAPHSSITVNVTVSATGSYGVNTGTQTVTIPISGTATLNISTTGDTTDEANGSVTVTVNTGNNYDLDSSASAATVTITDDDDAPPPPPVDVVTISVQDSIYVEGRSPFYLVRFKLNKPASERVTVKYTPKILGTGAGYATAGEDFVVRTSSISFRPGVTSNIGLIYALNDRVKEPDETFTIVLSEPQGAQIADSQPVLTIKDND